MRTARGTIGSRASHHETLFLKNNHFFKKIFCRRLFLEHQGTVSLTNTTRGAHRSRAKENRRDGTRQAREGGAE